MPFTVTRTDDVGVYDWDTIVSVYTEEGGPLESVTTNYDNGVSFAQTYTDGTVTTAVWTDGSVGGERFSFATRTETYDATGARTSRTDVMDGPDGQTLATVYDPATGNPTSATLTQTNGVQRVDTYNADGDRTQSVETDATGADSTQPWASRTTTYDPATGDRTSVETVNDNGTTQTDTYVDGVRSSSTQTDSDADVYSFSERVTNFDSDGAVTSSVTTRDDGVTETATPTYDADGNVVSRTVEYSNGITVTNAVDADGNVTKTTTDTSADGTGEPFVSSTTVTDAAGNRVSSTVVNDDGTIATTTFGAAGFKATQTLTDPADAFDPFDSRTETYDAAGVLTASTTTYDNGRTVTKTFVDGALTQSVDTDVDNAVDGYASSTNTYNADGDVTSRATVFDNGLTTTKTTAVDGGVTTTTTDGSADGALKNWATTTVVQAPDGDGNLVDVSREIELDNGVTVDTAYTDGVIASRTTNDVDNAIDGLATRTETFDAAGLIAERSETYDDGTSRLTTYVDGLKSESVFSDADVSEKPFEDVTTTYEASTDADGNPIAVETGRTTRFDTGVTAAKVLGTDGITTYTATDASADGLAKNWESVTSQFDETGRISTVIVNDDGTVKTTTYVDGVIASRVIEDVNDTNDRTDLQTETYNAAGNITSRSYELDDGSSRVETFDDGEILSRLDTDALADLKNYQTRELVFVNGEVDNIQTLLDSGDTLVLKFETDGSRDFKIVRDGTGAAPEFIVTEWDADGSNPMVTEYEDIDALNATYSAFF